MYTLNFTREWDSALFEFTRLLREKLGDNLVMIVGLDENDVVYDSNVLVVVREKSDSLIMSVAEIALQVNSKYECSINFRISTVEDTQTIEAFMYSSKPHDCEQSFNEFREKVLKIGGVVDVTKSDAYDSNVLVVVREKSDSLIMSVAEIALQVNSKYECSINFRIVENG
ncbi:hypothetical protein [Stygiolobus caldivivus]|uniref:Uncharacterized protein n=1 Tax=Stygiolobus caldivivus TaxID=2824673 RepID=A0A8D5U828_9CREN|nr:hypothetical protein [Stygiolobus caldivivus]BCU71089.1 hypothetical protein KN1_23860 [Stygiolobus caldivivus]